MTMTEPRPATRIAVSIAGLVSEITYELVKSVAARLFERALKKLPEDTEDVLHCRISIRPCSHSRR